MLKSMNVIPVLAVIVCCVTGMLGLRNAAAAETKLIRTFVNGLTNEIHDLHIEFNRLATAIQASGRSNFVPPLIQRPPANKIDILWPTNSLPPGGAVTITFVSPVSNIGITGWWWTQRGGARIGPLYTGNQQGHETPEQLRKSPPQDIYSIYNKVHHWGGAARFTNANSVVISMDLRKFLRNIPEPDRAKAEDNIRKAIKQWTDCMGRTTLAKVPKSGEGGVPVNHGPGEDPPVMAPGPTHRGMTRGQKFRSVSGRESRAAYAKYPKGLRIDVITTDGPPAPTEPIIPVCWGIPVGYPAGTAGVGCTQQDKKDPTRTAGGTIFIRPQGAKTKWHYAEDTDGDGYITNKDTDVVPADALDFYSIFKHELGHIISLNHSGDNFTDADPQPQPAVPSSEGAASGGHCPGCGAPHPQPTDESEDDEPGGVYYSWKDPGLAGGNDLRQAVWDGSHWTHSRLPDQVNSNWDDSDPWLAADGTALLFASNRPGGSGGWDIWMSIFDLASETWQPAFPLPGINSSADEKDPSLTGDMRTLYFSSNRLGGIGGWDIWSAELADDGAWSEAYNVGGAINGPFDELSASITTRGDLLIFASNRPGGIGGVDLWGALRRPGWTPPFNLGANINSPADENDPSIRADDRMLAFTSNRPSPKGDTVYESRLFPAPRQYPAWVDTWFTKVEQQEFQARLTPPADFDRDNVINGLEFAFGGNPHGGIDDAHVHLLQVGEGDSRDVRFQFRRPRDPIGIQYELQVSSDLFEWRSNGGSPVKAVTEITRIWPNADYEVVEFRVINEVPERQRYVRVRILLSGP